jgi:DNA-binding response OmpR family regulator
MKVLIVEDEKRMVSLLRKGFEEEGHIVVSAEDGIEGLEQARNQDFDVIILDVMMPKLNGYGFAEILRSEKISSPILMLTAKDAVEDIVHGLDLGADDYLTKPFSFQELLARLRAIKRRKFSPQATIIRVGDLSLNSATREVSRADISIGLTRTEYRLLEHLMECKGRVVPRERLIEAVWGHDRDIEDNTLDAFMRLLRNKVDGERRSKLIHTIRGVGYTIRTESSQQ